MIFEQNAFGTLRRRFVVPLPQYNGTGNPSPTASMGDHLRRGGVSPPDTAVQRDGEPVPYGVMGDHLCRGGVSPPVTAVQRDGEPVPYGVTGDHPRRGGVSPPDTAVQRDGEPVPYGVMGDHLCRGGISPPVTAVQRDGEPVPYMRRAGARSRRPPKGFHSASIDAKRSSIDFGGTKAPPYGVNGGSPP